MNELVKAVLAGIDADSGDETAREEATEALLLLVALVAELEQGASEKESRLGRYANLLQRIFHWDHMDTAADGPFWKSEIASCLAEAEGVGGG
jgi:hypothetical protein